MTSKQPSIVMIGAFPPPTNGMTAVNKAVLDRLRQAGAKLLVLDVAPPNLDRGFLARLRRLPKILHALVLLAIMGDLRGTKLYISISGGFGQIYEILFVLMARLRRMSLFMHHHSFAYLTKNSLCTQVLINAAGPLSVHITLSRQMAKRLKRLYKASQTVSISNTVFRFHSHFKIKKLKHELRTIGYLSNISAEKGVFEFLDLMTAIQKENLPLQGEIAGPFQDSYTENAVRLRLNKMKNVKYVGPKYGTDKDNFFNHIDLFVFPTRYVNEAEPLVVLEAMSQAVPVIAYGRGCIPEIVRSDCGRIVDNIGNFIPVAKEQIKTWLYNQAFFKAASQAASRQFIEIYSQNNPSWSKLMACLLSNDIGALKKDQKKSILRSSFLFKN